VEDMMICKAFIIVSEDSTVGASQKDAVFKLKMHSKYVSLISDQHSYESSLLQTSSSTITWDSYAQIGITGLPFHDRSPDSIYNRFKDKISPEFQSFWELKTLPTHRQEIMVRIIRKFARRFFSSELAVHSSTWNSRNIWSLSPSI
jgi:hypothetical protein